MSMILKLPLALFLDKTDSLRESRHLRGRGALDLPLLVCHNGLFGWSISGTERERVRMAMQEAVDRSTVTVCGARRSLCV